MNVIDFIIGLTLVNALPHFVLGIYKGRILSLFGFSPSANILYALLNLTVSISLLIYNYGIAEIYENTIYLGGLFVLVSYLLLGKLLYRKFHVAHSRGRTTKDITNRK